MDFWEPGSHCTGEWSNEAGGRKTSCTPSGCDGIGGLGPTPTTPLLWPRPTRLVAIIVAKAGDSKDLKSPKALEAVGVEFVYSCRVALLLAISSSSCSAQLKPL